MQETVCETTNTKVSTHDAMRGRKQRLTAWLSSRWLSLHFSFCLSLSLLVSILNRFFSVALRNWAGLQADIEVKICLLLIPHLYLCDKYMNKHLQYLMHVLKELSHSLYSLLPVFQFSELNTSTEISEPCLSLNILLIIHTISIILFGILALSVTLWPFGSMNFIVL